MTDELKYLRRLAELQDQVIRSQRAILKLAKREEALESFTQEEQPADGDVLLLVF